MDWNVDSLTAVIFTPPGQSTADALQLWSALDIGSPNSFQRPQGGLALASSIAQGIDGDTRLTMQCQIGRIDLTWTGAVMTTDAPPKIANLSGLMTKAEEQVCRLIEKVEIARLAVVGSSSFPIEDGISHGLAFNRLGLGDKFDPDAEDIIFQFNKVGSFKENGGRMNRLYSWSSGNMQMLSFNISPTTPSGSPFMAKLLRVLSFRADINSAADVATIDINLAEKYVGELFAEVRASFEEYTR